MKKIIALLLVLVLCIGMFAGCVQENEDLTKAKEYLYSLYVNKDSTQASDMRDNPLRVKGGDTFFDVKWDVTVTSGTGEVKLVDGEEGFVNVDVPDYPATDVNFTLTATISDEKGNTETFSFDYVVPAGIGALTSIADGTYVISTNGLTFSSLNESYSYGYAYANNVTVADGTVTGHTKADVLTITNVNGDIENGVTIQDAYGRYIYMTGTYNSFNVAAEAPEEGHIWQILSVDGGYLLVNAMNKKIVAYSTSYTSWGAYPKMTDDYSEVVLITPATAPAEDPSDDPSDNPVDTSGYVSAPVEGTPYKYMVNQVIAGKTLYITGGVSTRYLETTTDINAAADVYAEAVDGGYKFYILDGSTKLYIDVYFNADGKSSAQYVADSACVYVYDDTTKAWVTNVGGTDYYIGSYQNFETLSASKTSYIDASNTGVTQFPANLVTADNAGSGETGGETGDNTGDNTGNNTGDNTGLGTGCVTAPEVGVAYKLFVDHETNGKTLYFTGTTANYDYYLSTSENKADGADVYLESTDGGYLIYFYVGTTKTYLDIYQNGKYINARFTDAPTAVYTWNSEYNTLVATLADGETTAYIGAYGTYSTMSASASSYLGQSGSFWTCLASVD